MTYTTPTKVFLSNALTQVTKPACDQSLVKGRGGEIADQMQKAVWTANIRKNQAYTRALSRMATL